MIVDGEHDLMFTKVTLLAAFALFVITVTFYIAVSGFFVSCTRPSGYYWVKEYYWILMLGIRAFLVSAIAYVLYVVFSSRSLRMKLDFDMKFRLWLITCLLVPFLTVPTLGIFWGAIVAWFYFYIGFLVFIEQGEADE